jgi:hypothetical protein
MPLKRNRFLYHVIAVLAFFFAIGSSAVQDATWEPVAEGVEFREFRLAGPNRAFVARMDRLNSNVIIESAIAQGKLVGGKETVSGMVRRYQDALNTWNLEAWSQSDKSIEILAGSRDVNRSAWGARNQVVVAINGSLHNPSTGVTQGGVIHSGWYAKQYSDTGGKSGFVWKRDRSAFIGECLFHQPENQRVVNLSTGASLQLSAINDLGGRRQLVVYTPQYDRYSFPKEPGVEMLVEMTGPLEIMPVPTMAVGVVRGVFRNQDPMDIPFGHIVLSAFGKMDGPLIRLLKVGDPMGISLELTHYEENCRTKRDEDFTNAYAGIEGNFVFLEEGGIQSFDNLGATQRHPRTAICINDRYIHFVVVDGRSSGYSVGMNITELAQFCRDSLAATWGVNQDGGGSSAMWVDGEIVNRPSDGSERAVANGLMMVIPQAMERSENLRVGDYVETLQKVELRIGPGNSYAVTAEVTKGSRGVVLPHLNRLNGVLATGSHWWKVQFGEETGWVEEPVLVKIGSEPPALRYTHIPTLSGGRSTQVIHTPVE